MVVNPHWLDGLEQILGEQHMWLGGSARVEGLKNPLILDFPGAKVVSSECFMLGNIFNETDDPQISLLGRL